MEQKNDIIADQKLSKEETLPATDKSTSAEQPPIRPVPEVDNVIKNTWDMFMSPWHLIEDRSKRVGTPFEANIGGSKTVFVGTNEEYSFLYDDANVTKFPPGQTKIDLLLAGGKEGCMAAMDGTTKDGFFLKRRTFLLNNVTDAAINGYMPGMVDALDRTFDTWCTKKDFTLVGKGSELITRIGLRVFFGYSNDETESLAKDYLKIFDRLWSGGFAYVATKLPGYLKTKKSAQKLLEQIRIRLVYLIQKAKNGEVIPDCFISSTVKQFLKEGEAASIVDLTHELYLQTFSVINLVAVLAGTVAVLSQNHNVIDKVREEFAKDKKWKQERFYPTCAELDSLQYVSQVEKELLRFLPILPVSSNSTIRDLVINNVHIPKGVDIFGALRLINMDKRVYKNPEQFDPDRFSPERAEDTKAKCPFQAYATFGGGKLENSHKCLGTPFVTRLTRLFILQVTVKYELQIRENQDLSFNMSEVPAYPKDGVKIFSMSKNIDDVPEGPKGAMKFYDITIVTGKYKHASTLAEIHLILHGSKGDTKQPIMIQDFLHRHLGDSQVSVFSTNQTDLGEIFAIEFVKSGHYASDDWLINTVTVQEKNGKTFRFPWFGWMMPEDFRLTIREASGALPKDDQYTTIRQRQIEEYQKLYKWKDTPNGQPRVIDSTYKTLPPNERWNLNKEGDLSHWYKTAVATLGFDKVISLFKKWKSFSNFEDLFKFSLHKPKFLENSAWKTDEVFADIRLKGATLLQFERADSIPDNFGVSTELLKDYLRKGKTLEEECKNNRVFIQDYKLFENKPLLEGKWLPAPIILFYVNEQNKFLPVAIQLKQKKNPDWNPVYLPKDGNAWLYAKIAVGCADFGYFEAITHFGKTHFFTEPIIIATNRALALNHPVHLLLQPHFKYHLGINCLGRESLFNQEGLLLKIGAVSYNGYLEIMKGAFESWTYESLSFPNCLKDRKMENADQIPPGYYYREDGKFIWDRLRQFVKDILSLYYKSDDDVINDKELTNWREELDDIGYKRSISGVSKFPQIKTLESLIEQCTTFIFTGAAHHSVLNWAQWEAFAFVPFAPSALYKMPPGWDEQTKVDKSKITEEFIIKSLPSFDPTSRQTAEMYIITQYSDADEFLGQYHEFRFGNDKALELLTKFKSDLAEYGKVIDKRGWDHMHPVRKLSSSTSMQNNSLVQLKFQ